jgi:thiamine-phosphate pyrophosphorylase
MGQKAIQTLERARLYLCTDGRTRQGDLVEFLDQVLAAGVDVVQLREKGLEARDELRLLETVAAAAHRHGRLWAVNDRADIALAAGAPVLHLGQADLPVRVARRILGEDVVIGRSTHTPEEFDAGLVEPGVDYVCAGPTWATPTKPGRPAAGPALLTHANSVGRRTGAQPDGGRTDGKGGSTARPWFAIGGIDGLDRLDEVIALGARADKAEAS